MATVRQLHFIEVIDLTSGETQTQGTKASFATFTPTNGEVFQASAVVADAGAQVFLWNTGEGGLTTYEHCTIKSDKDITIELTGSTGSFTFSLKAGMTASFGGETFGPQAGTVDVMVAVTNISVKRNVADGVGDAFVQLFLVG